MFDLVAVFAFLVPGLLGAGSWMIANKSRGRNARQAFRLGAWGFWLTYLRFLGGFIVPVVPLIGSMILLAPAAICFVLAAQSMLREMRAQKQGDYTDAA